MASSPQLSQARSPLGSVSERGAEAAPEVRPAPSQDPGPSLGSGAGRRSPATSGVSLIKVGLRRVTDARSIYGCTPQAGGPPICTPRSLTPSLPSARRHSRRGGRDSGSWFAGLALRLHWSGGAETAAPGPAGGVGRRGPDGGSVCASIGGAGEWGGGAGSGGSGAAGGGCINREGGTCILGWVRGGRSAQRKWKVFSAGRPGPEIRVRTCRAGGAGGPPRRARRFFFFPPCKREGGVLLVSPPPSPPPRGESARGSAAAAIFPPLRTHGGRGRSAAAPPPPSPGPGKGPS